MQKSLFCLPFIQVDKTYTPDFCSGHVCRDEILLRDLRKNMQQQASGDFVVVLHQLGNHGPSYYLRYPEAFRKFTPTCDTEDLGACSREEIINTYDNALLYTDHFLAETIQFLQQQKAYDTAMIYLSDHGESLGENGLYLHGIPYAIAPKEQKQIPMVMWVSPDYAASHHLNTDCLKKRAAEPVSHDNLFSTVLGMMRVKTQVYESSMDLVAGCRSDK